MPFHRPLPLLLSLALSIACSPVDELGVLDDEGDLGALDDEDGEGNGLGGSEELTRPPAPAAAVTVDARKSLLESNPDALDGFTMDGVFQAIIDTAPAGVTTSASEAYNQIFSSFGDPSGTGVCTLDGYPLSCPRDEVELVDDMAGWFPIAAVNRFDLAPDDGSNCGEARLVFANRRESGIYGGNTQRAFLIFELVVPNPDPSEGLDGCGDIQWFWYGLADLSVSDRNQALLDAFLDGLAGENGFGAFLTFTNIKNGRIRTNTVFEEPWTLREFVLWESGDTLIVDQNQTPDAFYNLFWGGDPSLPNAAQCLPYSITDTVSTLTGDDLLSLSVSVESACEGAENLSSDADFATLLSAGTTNSNALTSDIQNELTTQGSSLTPTDIANRAQFAGSCIGCHETSNGVDLGGGLTAPSSLGFVHVSDVEMELVDGEQCFEISDALESTFLPSRQDNMESFLDGLLPEPGGAPGEAPPWLVSLNKVGGVNHVIQVDIETGATHDVCAVTDASTGMPWTGRVYSSTFTRDDRLLTSRASSLWEVSLPDCEATPLGSFGPYSKVFGISPDEADDLFGIDANTDTLLRIDSTTGAVTEVGPLSSDWHTLGVTWDDDAQLLLGLDANTDTIYEIDMATAMTNLLHALGTGFHQVAFEWHPRTGLAYACSDDTMLYRVETDGSLTALGVLGFGPGCLNLAAPWSDAAGLPPMP